MLKPCMKEPSGAFTYVKKQELESPEQSLANDFAPAREVMIRVAQEIAEAVRFGDGFCGEARQSVSASPLHWVSNHRAGP